MQITEDGETYSYSKTNPMKYGQFKIVKTSEDGIVEGLQFKVTRLVDGYSKIYTTDNSGTILTERLPIYEDIAGTKLFQYTMGSLANHELRTLRRTAHYYFDQLYKSGRMTRQDAYRWLADKMRTPLSEAHIGQFGEYYCKQVIEESRRVLGPQIKEKPERRGAS